LALVIAPLLRTGPTQFKHCKYTIQSYIQNRDMTVSLPNGSNFPYTHTEREAVVKRVTEESKECLNVQLISVTGL